MKKILLHSLFLLISFSSFGQGTIIKPFTVNPEFDKKISSTIHFTIPTISVATLKKELDNVYILDAREKKEYNISRIPNARYIGHTKMDKESLKDIPKDAKVVVYCSIGYRSEEIGEKIALGANSFLFKEYSIMTGFIIIFGAIVLLVVDLWG